jgi:hypothetical protein
LGEANYIFSQLLKFSEKIWYSESLINPKYIIQGRISKMKSQFAGQPATQSILIDVDALTKAYYSLQPNVSIPTQRASFGTSRHRGCSLHSSFNEAHILAVVQAICD